MRSKTKAHQKTVLRPRHGNWSAVLNEWFGFMVSQPFSGYLRPNQVIIIYVSMSYLQILFGFYGTLAFVGYLMLNPFLFRAIQFRQTVLI